MAYSTDSLRTIGQDGAVPDTRMKNAAATQDWVRRLIQNDQQRSRKRSKVNGLIDGNPPYRRSLLVKAGRADACNVNWGVARSFMEAGSGAFYDLFQESPTYLTARTSFGTSGDEREQYSQIITEEADRILREDDAWDYEMQLSIDNMVLHGCGPLFFEDTQKVLPRGVLCGDLKVPERTKSETKYWDGGTIQMDYYPPELFDFIRDPAAATACGWNVEYTKNVIKNAMNIQQEGNITLDWEWYQQQLKNNSFEWLDDTKICKLAFTFWREFPDPEDKEGRVTMAIVERETNTPSNMPDSDGVKYLMMSHCRYGSFKQAIHPMYFDHGNGGFHHSVTGLGVKMFSAMEYQNRLLCNLADKAFSPKMLFKPASAESSQKFSMERLGDYAVLSSNWEWTQTGVAGLMNDGLAMNNELTNIVSSTLSSYRQQVQPQTGGNPPTKYQKEMEAAMMSALSKTQFNRYYKQLDCLYEEIYRRMANLNSTDARAQTFQSRCEKRGVPREAIGRVFSVQATRVTGQGSAFMRKQALSSLWGNLGPALPEDGRDSLIRDQISAEAGQAAVERYYPAKSDEKMATDQESEAALWVGVMRNGTPHVVSSTQNPVVFSTTFLRAASQAVQSLQQGANPMEVLKFLETIGPAIAAQLSRFAKDPSRQGMFKEMEKQFHQLADITNKLKQQLAKQQQQQRQQQKKTTGVMSDVQLKVAKTKSDIAIKQTKAQAQLQQSREKHQLRMKQGVQQMNMADAALAHELTLNRITALNGNGGGE